MQCESRTYRKPFEPPMTSYREARERVVEWDKECVSGLNRSDITVKEFLPPSGAYSIVFAVVSATFVAFCRRSNFVPGGLISRFVPEIFVHFCWTIQPILFYSMLVIHVVEAAHMATGRLRKHCVNPRTAVFWKWVGTTFIEGFGAFKRFVVFSRLFCALADYILDSTK